MLINGEQKAESQQLQMRLSGCWKVFLNINWKC